MTETAVVVGAGLSGLAAAHRLQQAGLAVIVLEKSSRAGGLVATEHRDGYLVDIGADLINTSFVQLLSLANEVGLAQRIVASSQAVDVLRDGRAITVDRKRPWTLPTNPVLSPRGKLALARGYLRLRPRIRDLDPYALTGHADADLGTADELCMQHFDREVTDQLVDPILRAFAGTGTKNASGLSVMAAFAVGTKRAVAIEGGMSTLPDALAERLDVRFGAEVVSVVEDDGGVRVGHRLGSGTEFVTADKCVLAVPYHQAVPMWSALADAGGDFGSGLKDLPLMSISLGYSAPSPTPSYCVLVPSSESDEALLVMMQQNKSADRAPTGKTLVTIYTEAAVTARMMKRTDAELVDWAAGFIEGYYPSLRGRREMDSVARWPHTGYWPSPGYWKGIASMRDRMPRGNVHTTSTLFGSGGIERAILGGERAADRVLRQMGRGGAIAG